MLNTKTKKLICILLSVVICICALPTFSYLKVKSDTIKNGVIFETGVNIRENASISSTSLAKVSKVNVTVLEKVNDIDNKINPETQNIYAWYKVTYTSSSGTITGYVREDLISVQEYTLDPDFANQLNNFPESYRDALITLHALYPNWEFIPDVVPSTFKESVNLQDQLFYKLVQTTHKSWFSMRKGCYNWSQNKFVQTDSGGWYGASREVIAHYMDPRNFLNANDIFVFMTQPYDYVTQTVEGIENIVKGTFLDAEITDVNDRFYGKRYAAVIRYAGKQSKVNAYVLASTILQEQGINGSTLGKGAQYNNKTVYNFFNFGAHGNNEAAVLENGKKFAFEQGWFTPTDSIVNGAIKYGTQYINIGQDTYFYKNFNVLDPDNIWHQYAQNVADSVNSAKFLRTVYIQERDMKLSFRIPVYSELPENVSLLPEKSDKLNNYYFSSIKATGLTPAFNRYTFEYSLSLEDSDTVFVKCPNGAKYVGKNAFQLKAGENTVDLIIESETGYKNTYVINVFAEKSCTLKVSTENPPTPTPTPDQEKIVKGDNNGDGKITTSDLANVRLHLLGLINLKGNNLKGADTNGDSKITTSDLANIRLHLLGLITLK